VVFYSISADHEGNHKNSTFENVLFFLFTLFSADMIQTHMQEYKLVFNGKVCLNSTTQTSVTNYDVNLCKDKNIKK